MIKVIPLVSPAIDYPTLFSTCKELLGRSVTSKLDARGISTSTPAGFLHVLAEITDDDFGSALQHLSYSFLLICHKDALLDLCMHADLDVYGKECKYGMRLSIVTGTLLQWRTTFINSLSESSTDLVRIIIEQCLVALEQEGLGRVIDGYRKHRNGDKTLYLEQK